MESFRRGTCGEATAGGAEKSNSTFPGDKIEPFRLRGGMGDINGWAATAAATAAAGVGEACGELRNLRRGMRMGESGTSVPKGSDGDDSNKVAVMLLDILNGLRLGICGESVEDGGGETLLEG
jgi:hypothetical protein